ncbi:TetR/AcrR family transcriptional regulator [Streptomyces sp. NPDC050145]|uniref:TetR/AcrR family transcriptional regulator n=1 Tax=Streptomyces sp. NPDC050145 TaxID=3365602 RepID=UPI00378799B0
MAKQDTGRRERRTLRREAAVDAAFRLAAREGVAGLTMRKLAQELEVDVAALYRLYRDKDELLLACCERTIEMSRAELGEVPDDEAWQDTLRRFAEVTWRVQTAHPAITVLTFARTTGGPAEQLTVELLLTAFARSGAAPDRAVLLYRTFVDTCLGLCAHAAALATLDPDAQEKDATAWTRVYARAPEGDHPVTRAHRDALAAVGQKTIYDTAVEALIATTEAALTA